MQFKVVLRKPFIEKCYWNLDIVKKSPLPTFGRQLVKLNACAKEQYLKILVMSKFKPHFFKEGLPNTRLSVVNIRGPRNQIGDREIGACQGLTVLLLPEHYWLLELILGTMNIPQGTHVLV